MARSQPIVYSLSLIQSITQSLLHTPFPHPYLLVHLLYSNSLAQFFILFLHAPVARQVSLRSSPSSQQLSNSYPATKFTCSVQQGQLYDNNHSLYLMRWEFEQTMQSPNKQQQTFTVIMLLCPAALNTLNLFKYIILLLPGKEDMFHSKHCGTFSIPLSWGLIC